jgi:hypothetical protein
MVNNLGVIIFQIPSWEKLSNNVNCDHSTYRVCWPSYWSHLLMHQSDLFFTFEYTILSEFRINVISNIVSMSFSLWQYFNGKTTPNARSVHNTYTSTRSLQLRLIKINHKNSMCNSLRKWNAQFHFRLRTIHKFKTIRIMD